MTTVKYAGIIVESNGDTWDEAAKEAIKQATAHNQMVKLSFRGIDLIVHQSDEPDRLWDVYSGMAGQERRRASWDGGKL